jgi:alkylhydroperoxidase family enzyme
LADALMEDYRTAPVDAEMKQLLSFVEKVARDASRITPDDLERVRLAGFTDRAILDAVHVAGFFGYMNRVVQALGADGKASAAVMMEQKKFSMSSSEAPAQI